MNSKAKGFFYQTHPKIVESTFAFHEFLPTSKKSVYSFCSFLRESQFWILVTRLAKSIFDHVHTKYFQSSFNLPEFVPACKKSVIPSVHFEIHSVFDFCYLTGHTHFWPCPPKSFWSAFNFCEYVSTCIKPVIIPLHSSNAGNF